MKSENKNVFLAVLCTILVFLTLDYFFPRDRGNVSPDSIHKQTTSDSSLIDTPVLATEQSPILKIQSQTLKGQILLKGLIFNDLTFLEYKQTVQKDSPDVVLLQNDYFMMPYINGKNIDLPNNQTIWQADNDVLTPLHPVNLTWTNKQGITFNRQISLDDK